jgi:hypothetical protein
VPQALRSDHSVTKRPPPSVPLQVVIIDLPAHRTMHAVENRRSHASNIHIRHEALTNAEPALRRYPPSQSIATTECHAGAPRFSPRARYACSFPLRRRSVPEVTKSALPASHRRSRPTQLALPAKPARIGATKSALSASLRRSHPTQPALPARLSSMNRRHASFHELDQAERLAGRS